MVQCPNEGDGLLSNGFNTEHLQKFIEYIEDSTQSVLGKSAITWCENIKKRSSNNDRTYEDFPLLPSERQCRYSLQKWINDIGYSDLKSCSAAILAWGGMKVSHGHLAFQSYDLWGPIINGLYNGSISKEDAYDRFLTLRQRSELKGMGIAYFTKLIFFITHTDAYLKSRNHSGYILDQWTARSINLLSDTPIITMQSSWVSDKNTGSVYGKFCEKIEQLADLIHRPPAQTEELLFSHGGRNKGSWRAYIIAQ